MRTVIQDRVASEATRRAYERMMESNPRPSYQPQSEAEAWRQAWISGKVSLGDVPARYRSLVAR